MTNSADLKVGHIIKLRDNQMVPADCVVLSAVDANGLCYISTESLDGERNLKPKLAPQLTQGKMEAVIKQQSRASIEYIQPDKNIYFFDGNLTLSSSANSESKKLELKNFIPRGSVVKNSEEILALIVYTGVDTKLALNLGTYQFKISRMQVFINKFILVNIVLWVGLIILMSQILLRIWMSKTVAPISPKFSHNHYYIFPTDHPEGPFDSNFFSIKAILTYYLLLNGVVPLNLTVNNVLSKFVYTIIMRQDKQMTSEWKS